MVDIEAKVHGSTIVPRKREDPDLTRAPVVRVRATQEKYRRVLRHGITHQRFLPDINQSVEWPNDAFTHRRLREGSVALADEGEGQHERASRSKRIEPPKT